MREIETEELLIVGGFAAIVAFFYFKSPAAAINKYIDTLAQTVTGDPTQSGGGIVYDLLHPSTGWADLANGGKMAVPGDVWAARLYILRNASDFTQDAVKRAANQLSAANMLIGADWAIAQPYLIGD